MAPSFYDPHSPDEQPVPLPSAPRRKLGDKIVLQPPLTRRGTGPGLIVVLPASDVINPRSEGAVSPLDPEPIQKWAEEGFAVVGITAAKTRNSSDLDARLREGIQALLHLLEMDKKDTFAVIVYDPEVVSYVMGSVGADSRLACLVAYGPLTSEPSFDVRPILFHLSAGMEPLTSKDVIYKYSNTSPFFVIPGSADYDSGSAALAHSRTLVFLRKHLGGPHFDLEAIWDEHCYFEFEVRSVAKTMGTMVEEPYVNHVPTMTGGIGRKQLTEFYRDHFIFSNPPDTALQLVSRTVGADRVVDEFIFKLTHDRVVDWLLPGVPPTHKKLAIPMMGVINIRGDRLYHEHIWWDQGTVLMQAGLIPSHVPFSLGNEQQMVRLPVAGVESARLLADETDGKSNEMFGPDWGLSRKE